MADVRDQLQAALGSAFTIERELVGGGMSRVFVATETSLGRRVAIKVLSPELANAISAELDRAVESKDWSALMIGLYPEFAPLRADPRFAKIRRATHLEGVPSAPVPP